MINNIKYSVVIYHMDKSSDLDYLPNLVLQINKFKHIKMDGSDYCIDNLLNDLEWLSNTVCFTKSFSDYLMYINRDKSNPHEFICPLEITNTDSFQIIKNTSFLNYKSSEKDKYRNLICILKALYKNAMELPDVEKVIRAIDRELNINTHVYFINPEFIFDDYLFHIYNCNNISDNYEQVKTMIKAFEYLCYKTINYINELEFDAGYPSKTEV